MNKSCFLIIGLCMGVIAHAQAVVKVRGLTTKDSIDFARRIDSLKNGQATLNLANYYPKGTVDSLIAAKSIDAIIDTSLTGQAIDADPLRVNPNLTLTTLTTTQQAFPFTGYTVNTNRKIGYQFVDNGDGTISIQVAFLDTAPANTQAITTTEGQPLQTTEGQTIIFN